MRHPPRRVQGVQSLLPPQIQSVALNCSHETVQRPARKEFDSLNKVQSNYTVYALNSFQHLPTVFSKDLLYRSSSYGFANVVPRKGTTRRDSRSESAVA